MKRLLPGAWLAVSCGLMSIVLFGCPGTLDPGVGPSGGGMGGMSGTGGCEVPILANCAGCHFAGSGSAGLDLGSPNIGSRLVGVMSSDNSANGSACPNKVLLDPNSNPASGFFIDKITLDPPALCGSRMPIPTALSSDQISCLKTWAITLTTGTQAFIEEDKR